MKRKRGFTLIELLVVMVIIGILTQMTTATFRSYINRANNAKDLAELRDTVTEVQIMRVENLAGSLTDLELMNAEMALIDSVISLARNAEEKTLLEITGSGCSDCVCRDEYLVGESLSPEAQECVDTWQVLTDIFLATSNINLSFLNTDPWGSPYLIDENEGENGGNYCRADNIFSAGPDQYHEAAYEAVEGDGFQRSLSFYDSDRCP